MNWYVAIQGTFIPELGVCKVGVALWLVDGMCSLICVWEALHPGVKNWNVAGLHRPFYQVCSWLNKGRRHPHTCANSHTPELKYYFLTTTLRFMRALRTAARDVVLNSESVANTPGCLAGSRALCSPLSCVLLDSVGATPKFIWVTDIQEPEF